MSGQASPPNPLHKHPQGNYFKHSELHTFLA